MPELSVVVITYNEELNLARCLDSVSGLADELLVVDSYSTDATVEIAQSKGARVISHVFAGHVAQKNYALSQASHDLVLSLDADEALDEKAQNEIQAIKTDWKGQAYVLRRRNNYLGKWIRFGGWYPDKKLRLVNRNQASWQGKNPHDKLVPEIGASITELKGHILHYTIGSIQEHLETIHSFSSLAASSKFEAGQSSNLLKICFAPLFKFVKGYIFQLGILDGYRGFLIASLSAYASYLRYRKLHKLTREAQR